MEELRKDRPLNTSDIASAGDAPPAIGGAAPVRSGEEQSSAPLFAQDETELMRTRWTDIQASFVDEPRKAVQEADALVASAIKRLAEEFANERNGLERQWDRGDNVSTEDLRVALRRYRSFFDRLLSV